MTVALDGLTERLDDAARVPRLLVACDFDGTLSDIVEDPDSARPRSLASRSLDLLARTPETLVSVVSGRALADLHRVSGETLRSDRVRMFGSHGLEADDGTTIGMARAMSLGRDGLVREIEQIAALVPGLRVEHKPYGAALHFRGIDPAGMEPVLQSVRQLRRGRPEVFLKPGKCVIELSVLPLCKAFAIDTLQHQWVPDVTIYAGDDRTDEDVFTAMWPGDIGIKVGGGPSAAAYRVSDPEQLERLLWRLADRRGRVVAGWPVRST